MVCATAIGMGPTVLGGPGAVNPLYPGIQGAGAQVGAQGSAIASGACWKARPLEQMTKSKYKKSREGVARPVEPKRATCRGVCTNLGRLPGAGLPT